jgi:phosphopantetheine adenylyltransferase
MDSIDDESKNKPETSPELTEQKSLANASQSATESPEAPQNANVDDEIDISEEPEPKKDQKADKSQFSDLEKAEFSFKKQLGKQKQKYESILADQKKAFASLQERLEKLENPDKHKEKFRENFQTDDEYIDYIVQQRMNKILDEQNEKAMKDREEEAKAEEAREFIDKNIETCFTTNEARTDYFNTVKAAFDEGLQELMDKEKYVAEYIMRNPNGPKILYELAKDKEKVRQIYSQGDPMSRLFELKMIEREILTKPTANKSNPNLQKAIGKPGISKETTADIFSSKDDLKRFIRMR